MLADLKASVVQVTDGAKSARLSAVIDRIKVG
jgi:hypothetical protein